MADLLVPGTGGSKLLLDGVDVGWPFAAKVTAWAEGKGLFDRLESCGVSTDRLEECLSMEYADAVAWTPSRSTLKPGGAIAAGAPLMVAYNQFANGFDSFHYDWRCDLRDSAERLLSYLIANQPGGQRWRLMGHSQGGLLIVAASKRYAEEHGDDPEAFAQLVSHVALVGTPLHGTLAVVDALVNAEELTGPYQAACRRILRTWPALHQMLPVWPGSVRLQEGAATREASYNLMDDRTWEGLGELALTPTMLARARTTRRAYLRNPLAEMRNVKKRIVYSRAHETRNHVVIEDHRKLTLAGSEAGDGRVPEETSRWMGNDEERANSNSFGAPTARHFVMCCDPVIATEVRTFFAQ